MIEAFSNMFEMDYTIFRICVPYGNKFGSSYSYGTIGFFYQAESGKRCNQFVWRW
ncbi:MAG: hypothetical protein IPG99_07415 [Ignavibacteria bacterium]|nr:hypothetical protein [Ignavibacteria bacterium]